MPHSIPERSLPRRARLAFLSFAALVLLAPAVAMPFTREVNWGPGDFAAAFLLLAATWAGLELSWRFVAGRGLRLASSLLVLVALLAVWSWLAVGW
jgi:hypothetical protein